MKISLVPAGDEWLDDWLRLREAVYTGIDRNFHRQEMKKFLASDELKCYLALVDRLGSLADAAHPEALFRQQAIGMIELSLRNIVDGCLSSPVGYIEGIYVEPAFRGQGLARALYQQGEAWFRSKGCVEIATDAEIDNEAAQRFHRQLGFAEPYRIVEFRKSLVPTAASMRV